MDSALIKQGAKHRARQTDVLGLQSAVPGTAAAALPQCRATGLPLGPGRAPSQDERIIHSLEPIQSSASRLTLPTEVPINANYNGDFSDMGTYSYRPSNSHHILMTVSHYQYGRSLN